MQPMSFYYTLKLKEKKTVQKTNHHRQQSSRLLAFVSQGPSTPVLLQHHKHFALLGSEYKIESMSWV